MSVTHTLTGRKRHRIETRLFRSHLVVLQVEIRARGFVVVDYGYVDDVDYLYWKDAAIENLTVEDEK